MRILISIAMSIGLLASTAACNTVEGVGKDVKSTGKAIEKAGK